MLRAFSCEPLQVMNEILFLYLMCNVLNAINKNLFFTKKSVFLLCMIDDHEGYVG